MALQGNEPVEADYFAEIEDLFFDALDLPPNQRETWIKTKCKDRASVFTEVQTLLEAHLSSEEFLSDSPDLKGIAACPDLTGRRLGSYEVVEEIAKGGMGRVYSAERVDGEYEQRVAIKAVELGNIEAELFRRERQTLANLEHPNIVTLLDGGTLEEGFPYLVMELVEGQAIDSYNISNKLNNKEIVALFGTLCNVVNQAHQQGVIHCDLKPANILVTDKGILKLLDFGISQSLIKTHEKQAEGAYPQGLTPEYSSPQRREHKPPHVADDVYSLGIILGQLLIGGLLPRVATELLVNKRYKQIDLEKFLTLIPSRELREIVKKATNDDSDKRYVSAHLMGEDLNNWLEDKPVLAVASSKKWPLYALSKNLIRNRKAWLILLILGVLFAIGAYFWNQANVDKLNTEAAAAAKKVTADLAAVLSRTQPSISVQSELTGLALNNIEKTLLKAPDNIPARHVYSSSLVRYGQLEGHPLYLSKENPKSAIQYLTAANENLGLINNILQERGDASFPAVGKDDPIDLETIEVDQLTIDRLIAEIHVYYEQETESDSKEEGLMQLRAVEEKLLNLKYQPKSRIRKLSYAEDLVYLSHARLLVDNFEVSKGLLDKAKNILDNVAAVGILPTAGLAVAEVKRRDGINNSEVEVLKRTRFLKSFILEQRAYVSFKGGDMVKAGDFYKKIIAMKSTKDVQLDQLINRVRMMQSCISLSQNKSALAQTIHGDIVKSLSDLLEDHPGAKRLVMINKQVTNSALTLAQQLDCKDPRFIVFPLRKVSLSLN
jgi:serine/threonine protein kinase